MALSAAERQKRRRERVKAKLAKLAMLENPQSPQLGAVDTPADDDDWVEQALALFERMSREQKRRFAAEIVAGKSKREG